VSVIHGARRWSRSFDDEDLVRNDFFFPLALGEGKQSLGARASRPHFLSLLGVLGTQKCGRDARAPSI